MAPAQLEDRIRWGNNVAARAAGVATDAYRASSNKDPLDARNRFVRLPALFMSMRGTFDRTNGYGNALWHGLFDAAYTRPGDYLVRPEQVWFIAAQERLLPVLCVRTNRIVTFSRPAAQTDTGVNNYGGVTADDVVSLLSNWPASVLAAPGSGRPQANLPSDSSVSFWTVLLPAYPGTVLRPADLMSDDLGRNAVVLTSELSELGWRVTVKQVTT
jgi:hypothetical protein